MRWLPTSAKTLGPRNKMATEDKRSEIIACIEQRLSPQRFQHSLGVEKFAVEHCERLGINRESASTAALLHDFCREYPPQQLLQTAIQLGLPVDDVERAEPILLHGAVGAVEAAARFAITDSAIIEAITYHITGGPQINPLAKLIFISDSLEPGRQFPGVDEMRAAANVLDLQQLTLLVYDRTLQYLTDKGYTVHPRTIAGRDEIINNL